MAPFASPLEPVPYPALYLYPLNDSFIPKHISLINGQRVKIGRQTNAKTVPLERNGYFDSKVLSRQHAEVWEDSGKVRDSLLEGDNTQAVAGTPTFCWPLAPARTACWLIVIASNPPDLHERCEELQRNLH